MPVQLQKFNLQTPQAGADGKLITYYEDTPFPANQYFEVRADGKVFMRATTLGDTSENSDRTRTELREVIEGTHDQMNWLFGDFAHQFLRGAVTLGQVTPNGKVVIGQIHVKDNNRPPLKLLWDNGSIRVKFRPVYNQEDDDDYTLISGLSLVDRVNYSIHVTDNGHVSVNVSANDNQVQLGLDFDTSFADKLLYFKLGLYNQEDPNPAIHTAADGTEGVWDKIEVDRY